MVTLAHALRSFRTGALSRDALFTEIDRILEGGRASKTWLLETLHKENTEVPLPPDVHDAVLTKIRNAKEATATGSVRQTASEVAGDGEFVDPDESYTRLATSVFFDEAEGAEPPGPKPTVPPAWSETPAAGVNEPIKGAGDVLNGRFVLEERIGTGGMSAVYKALDRRKLEADDRNPYVAVKVLNLEFRARPDSLIALQREAKKSQSLAHTNIVRVYDFDRDGSTVYMTMEYLSGQPLAKRLRAPNFRGMPEHEALGVLEGMASALAFAHDNGIVHADFKPGNVILTETGQVKVIDFGIARAFQRPDEDQEATRFDPGSLGALTPTYASPEMLEHKEPDPRDDIYALACITYEMLTGRHPFGRMQATEARDGGLQLDRRGNLTRRQFKALKSALAFEREARTPSVRQFLEDLRPEPKLSVPIPLYGVAKAVGAFLLAGLGLYAVTTFYEPGTDTVGPETDSASIPVPTQGESDLSAAPAVETAPDDSPNVASATPLTVAAVRALLDPIPCSAIAGAIADGNITLQGYVSKAFDSQALRRDLLALQGAQGVTEKLIKVDADKCAALDLYAPYWVANRAAEQPASIQMRNGVTEIQEGEPLVVNISTPPYESYVSVDYYALDGNVVHMVPSPRISNHQAPAKYQATLGDLGEWTIAEPFGNEMVVLMVAPRPLFDTQRGEAESSADYLAALRQQLARLDKESELKKVAVDFVLIDTKPKALLQRLREKTPW